MTWQWGCVCGADGDQRDQTGHMWEQTALKAAVSAISGTPCLIPLSLQPQPPPPPQGDRAHSFLTGGGLACTVRQDCTVIER